MVDNVDPANKNSEETGAVASEGEENANIPSIAQPSSEGQTASVANAFVSSEDESEEDEEEGSDSEEVKQGKTLFFEMLSNQQQQTGDNLGMPNVGPQEFTVVCNRKPLCINIVADPASGVVSVDSFLPEQRVISEQGPTCATSPINYNANNHDDCTELQKVPDAASLMGPVEESGMVSIGDELLAINGIRTKGKDMPAVVSLIQHSSVPLSLTFLRPQVFSSDVPYGTHLSEASTINRTLSSYSHDEIKDVLNQRKLSQRTIEKFGEETAPKIIQTMMTMFDAENVAVSLDDFVTKCEYTLFYELKSEQDKLKRLETLREYIAALHNIEHFRRVHQLRKWNLERPEKERRLKSLENHVNSLLPKLEVSQRRLSKSASSGERISLAEYLELKSYVDNVKRELEEAKQSYYCPEEKGYHIRFGGEGTYIGCSDIWIEEFHSSFELRVKSSYPQLSIKFAGNLTAEDRERGASCSLRFRNFRVAGDKFLTPLKLRELNVQYEVLVDMNFGWRRGSGWEVVEETEANVRGEGHREDTGTRKTASPVVIKKFTYGGSGGKLDTSLLRMLGNTFLPSLLSSKLRESLPDELGYLLSKEEEWSSKGEDGSSFDLYGTFTLSGSPLHLLDVSLPLSVSPHQKLDLRQMDKIIQKEIDKSRTGRQRRLSHTHLQALKLLKLSASSSSGASELEFLSLFLSCVGPELTHRVCSSSTHEDDRTKSRSSSSSSSACFDMRKALSYVSQFSREPALWALLKHFLAEFQRLAFPTLCHSTSTSCFSLVTLFDTIRDISLYPVDLFVVVKTFSLRLNLFSLSPLLRIVEKKTMANTQTVQTVNPSTVKQKRAEGRAERRKPNKTLELLQTCLTSFRTNITVRISPTFDSSSNGGFKDMAGPQQSQEQTSELGTKFQVDLTSTDYRGRVNLLAKLDGLKSLHPDQQAGRPGLEQRSTMGNDDKAEDALDSEALEERQAEGKHNNMQHKRPPVSLVTYPSASSILSGESSQVFELQYRTTTTLDEQRQRKEASMRETEKVSRCLAKLEISPIHCSIVVDPSQLTTKRMLEEIVSLALLPSISPSASGSPVISPPLLQLKMHPACLFHTRAPSISISGKISHLLDYLLYEPSTPASNSDSPPLTSQRTGGKQEEEEAGRKRVEIRRLVDNVLVSNTSFSLYLGLTVRLVNQQSDAAPTLEPALESGEKRRESSSLIPSSSAGKLPVASPATPEPSHRTEAMPPLESATENTSKLTEVLGSGQLQSNGAPTTSDTPHLHHSEQQKGGQESEGTDDSMKANEPVTHRPANRKVLWLHLNSAEDSNSSNRSAESLAFRLTFRFHLIQILQAFGVLAADSINKLKQSV